MPFSQSFFLSFNRLRRRLLKNYQAVRLVMTISILAVLVGVVIMLAAPLLRVAKDLIFGPVNVFSVLLPHKNEIKNTDGRTNILLLGIGGTEHDGPNLSDTMIIASFKTLFSKDDKTTAPVVLISIPRDIYLDSLSGKINTAYAIGAEKGPGTGLILAKGAVSEISGLPIHYGVRVDFSAFEKIIDLIGGVDVNVEHTLDDFKYPLSADQTTSCHGNEDDPCWYEHLHFDKGPNHLDGKTALKFVRSRHAEGDEGTDFARARRQQLVISAVKNKMFSTETLLNPKKIEEIYQVLKSHIDSDINPKELNNFLNLALKYRTNEFKSVVLGLDQLENPPIDERGWILLPKGGNWDQIHSFIKSQLL